MPNSPRSISACLSDLRAGSSQLLGMPLIRRISMLDQLIATFPKVAEKIVTLSCQAKQIHPHSPAEGEEWLAGPFLVIRNLVLLKKRLEQLLRSGTQSRSGLRLHRTPQGHPSLLALPHHLTDRLIFPGFHAEVWLDPAIQKETLCHHLAQAYHTPHQEPRVCLVLGAGNVSSIGPMDVLSKIFIENKTCLLKLNPVNDYLLPLFEQGLAPLIESQLLRITTGNAEVGAMLVNHPDVDEIHITGSLHTHESIVWGDDPNERLERKKRNDPLLDKPITSELGNVSPVILVPGNWSQRDLTYQAMNVASMLTNNAGYNCSAAKVLITHAGWSLREPFLEELKKVLNQIPPRAAWYPGTTQRYERLTAGHPTLWRTTHGDTQHLPWTLIPDLDPNNPDEICFREEAFCGLLAETALPASDPLSFLQAATQFCNKSLWGTLNCTLIVHPSTLREPTLRQTLNKTIQDLHYGTVGLNHWSGLAYGFVTTPWFGAPGQTLADPQSGIGSVHNTLMVDAPRKVVFHSPFRLYPTPAWFPLADRSAVLARQLIPFQIHPRWFHLPPLVWHAIHN